MSTGDRDSRQQIVMENRQNIAAFHHHYPSVLSARSLPGCGAVQGFTAEDAEDARGNRSNSHLKEGREGNANSGINARFPVLLSTSVFRLPPSALRLALSLGRRTIVTSRSFSPANSDTNVLHGYPAVANTAKRRLEKRPIWSKSSIKSGFSQWHVTCGSLSCNNAPPIKLLGESHEAYPKGVYPH